jgi:hypothetical protein
MSFQINKPEGSLGRVELNDTLDPNIDGFATVWSTGAHHAPLLAAAPDLLAFVKEYIDAWENGMAGDSYLLRLAQAAIAKTEGQHEHHIAR